VAEIAFDGETPTWFAADAEGLWVTLVGEDQVARIDPETNRVVARIDPDVP
jgi:hypothetical protein